jgi:hypothetical protein
MNGYVIPDSINREVASANRAFSNTQVVFGLEVANSKEQFTANLNKPTRATIAAVSANDSVNVTVNQTITNVANSTLVYINTNKQLTGTFVNQSTVTFPAGWIVAPTGLPATSVDNFTFFCNGQFIEKPNIVSFTELNGVSTLVVDPALLQYGFEVTDEVVAIGKFI